MLAFTPFGGKEIALYVVILVVIALGVWFFGFRGRRA
jgi:hypothetical protein